MDNAAWDLQQVHQLQIIGRKEVMSTVEEHYEHFRRGLELFYVTSPYGFILTATIDGNTSE